MNTNQSIFNVFQQGDKYFELLNNAVYSSRHIYKQILFIFLFSFFYGIIMGSYNGIFQSLITGFKIPVLLFLSLLICLPALYVIQYMIGSKMSFFQMSNMILSGFVVFSTISLSFSTIVIFFMITSTNYAFLKLLHVVIFFFRSFCHENHHQRIEILMRKEKHLS